MAYEQSIVPLGASMDAQGAITWSLPPLPECRGEYTIRIRVSEGKGGQATQDFTLRLSQPAGTR